MSLEQISQEELNKTLRSHELWLQNKDGQRADLHNKNLYGLSFVSRNLRLANLNGAVLRYCNFSNANLNSADLRNTDLYSAYFGGADLRGVRMDGAVFVPRFKSPCPKEGSFIGYKKALRKIDKENFVDAIIVLEIPKEAKRSSASITDRGKCRCDYAIVKDIYRPDTGESVKTAHSIKNRDFIYRVGSMVKSDDFDSNRFNECSDGIHFFMTLDEALNYRY